MASKTKKYSIAICGLEPEDVRRTKEEIKEDLYLILKKYIELGFKYFTIGLERGSSMWAGEVVLSLKVEYPDIKLICVDPSKDNHLYFETKDSNFVELDEDFSEKGPVENSSFLYDVLAKGCDLYVSIFDEYNTRAEKLKNEWILNKTSILVAVNLPGIKGKTKNMVDCATKKGLKVHTING